MTATKDELIEAFLKYQEDKNKLVKEFTKLTLIPKRWLLDDKGIEGSLEVLLERFRASPRLGISNCLHCNIYKLKIRIYRPVFKICGNCPYNTPTNNCMCGSNPIYTKVQKVSASLDNRREVSFSERLEALGKTLEVVMEAYKKGKENHANKL